MTLCVYIYIISYMRTYKRHKQTLKQNRRKEGNILFNDALNTFFIYGYMASDIWLRTILIVRKETLCRHLGYSFRLTASVLLYAPSHRQDSTYHGLCYTRRGALPGKQNRNDDDGDIIIIIIIIIIIMKHQKRAKQSSRTEVLKL